MVGAVGTPLDIAESKAQHLELGGRETEPECREGSRDCRRHLGIYSSCLTGRADQVRADDRHRKTTGRGQATRGINTFSPAIANGPLSS